MDFLIKIQESRYIDDMYENEYLYFSVFLGFRKKDDTDHAARFDPREGNLANRQIKSLLIEVDGKKYNLSKDATNFKGQLMEHLVDPKINICSLFKLKFDSSFNLVPFSERICELGDKALIILDHEKFCATLDMQLEKMGYEYSRRTVTYYDPNEIDGEISLHHKDHNYGFQQEYRILIGPAGIEGLKIPIPGLKSNSLALETKNLKNIKLKSVKHST